MASTFGLGEFVLNWFKEEGISRPLHVVRDGTLIRMLYVSQRHEDLSSGTRTQVDEMAVHAAVNASAEIKTLLYGFVDGV